MWQRLTTWKLPAYLLLLTLFLLGGAIALAAYVGVYPESVLQYHIFLPGARSAEEVEFGSWPALANSDFFRQVRAKFVDEKTDFIEADLTSMKLTIYRGGEAKSTFPILTKGREGSWWETPAGLYRVAGKERNHYSSFAGVYLPWSLPFQGNFFIHGWPYYPDGEPVSSKYSGGCIRLSTEDAEEVYRMAGTGMPVLVFESDFAQDDFPHRFKTPEFAAGAYLAADLKSNFPFLEKDAALQLPAASITKLMTALVAVEYMNIEQEIRIRPAMLVPTSVPRLKSGQSVSLYNLLPLLLMESSNEAATAIATHLGAVRFIDLMNQKAKAIGMEHTRFVDASGSSEENVSTARDLFELAKHLYYNRSFILKMTRGEVDQRVYGPLDFAELRNFNGFGEDPEFVGGKVGQTEAAGQTILSVFDFKTAEGPARPLAVIALRAQDNVGEAGRMVEWIRQNYR